MSLQIFKTMSDSFVQAVKDLLSGSWQMVGDAWRSIVGYVEPKSFSDLAEGVGASVDSIDNHAAGPPSTWSTPSTPEGKLGSAIASGTGWFIGVAALILKLLEHGKYNTFMRFLDYEAARSAKAELPGPGVLTTLLIRKEDNADVTRAMEYLGFGDWARESMVAAAQAQLSTGDAWTLYRKDDREDRQAFEDRLKLAGWLKPNVGLLDHLMEHDAAPQDLVTLMYRGEEDRGRVIVRMVRQGWSEDAANDYVDSTRVLVPLDSAVNGMYAGEVGEDGLAARFEAMGVSEDDALLAARMAWRPLGVEESTRAYFRGLEGEGEALKRLQRLRYRPDDARRALEVIRPKVDVSTAISLYRRGQLDEGEAQDAVQAAGFSQADATDLLSLYRTYLSVGDIVDLAARSTGSASQGIQWDSAEGQPDGFAESLAVHGFSEDDAAGLWRRHWTMPGLAEVIDAWHRQQPGGGGTVIGEADVDAYLAASGVAPGWRPVVKALQYQPLPLRLISSMYQRRVLDDAEVHDQLLNLGLRPDLAVKYGEYLSKEFGPDSLKVTPGEILDSYRRKILTRPIAAGLLIDSGLSDRTAEFYLEREDAIIEHERKRLSESSIKAMLHNGVMSESDARDRMHTLGWDGADIEALIREWAIEGEPKRRGSTAATQKLTHAEIDSLYLDGHIREPDWHSLMG
jgi:hypothetical protein